MSDNPPSNERYLQALDLAIQFLQEHERNIDRLIDNLSIAMERLSAMNSLNKDIERIDGKVTAIAEEAAKLKKALIK